ncbi:MAG: hydroxypyruvate isomerase family protein [Minwuia sp.]|uniref:hydroxypyruvate isomerase family protein n=1 Tax=Minwuia sp. TaxID=2493630 RepID=UPI003A8A5EAE
MPRFSANIDLMFTERPFMERFAAAAAWGFPEVEILNPHAHDTADIVAAAKAAGVRVTLINTPIPRMADGDRGAGVDLATAKRSEDEARQTVETAAALGVMGIHVMAGLADRGDATAEAAFVDHVRRVADLAAPHGIRAMLEPLNPVDFPGYFLNDVDQALRLRDRIARDNVWLQFDFYHFQIIHGDVVRLYRQHVADAGHIQIANPPDRREPGAGELDYRFIFDVIDESGWTAPVSLEYRPSTTTEESLRWAADYGYAL